MKKIMVIVLATTIGTYGYAQNNNNLASEGTNRIVKKLKSRKLPPPPPLPAPPAPLAMQVPNLNVPPLPPPPPPPPMPSTDLIEEGSLIAPPPPPPPPLPVAPPPTPPNTKSLKIRKAH